MSLFINNGYLHRKLQEIKKKTKTNKQTKTLCPGWVAQLVRVSSPHTKIVGSIPGQGTYKKQPMNTKIDETTNPWFSLSLPFSLKSINKKINKTKRCSWKKQMNRFFATAW